MNSLITKAGVAIVAIVIFLGSNCFSQNEAAEKAEKESKAPKKLFSKPLSEEDHPVLLSFFKGSEGIGASICIENPNSWKKMSYGLSISKDAPIGLFLNFKPWTVFDESLYINMGFGAAAKVKVDMSNMNFTSKTFKDQDNILLFFNFGLTYELGRLEVGAFYKLGQQFPIVKKPMAFSWFQGWELSAGFKL